MINPFSIHAKNGTHFSIHLHKQESNLLSNPFLTNPFPQTAKFSISTPKFTTPFPESHFFNTQIPTFPLQKNQRLLWWPVQPSWRQHQHQLRQSQRIQSWWLPLNFWVLKSSFLGRHLFIRSNKLRSAKRCGFWVGREQDFCVAVCGFGGKYRGWGGDTAAAVAEGVRCRVPEGAGVPW